MKLHLPTWTELKQRRLVQWTLTYLAGAWLVFQIVGVLAQGFAWAVVLLRFTTVLLAIGFFVAVVVAWYHGEQGRQRVTALELGILTAILALGSVGFFLVRQSEHRDADPASSAGAPALEPNAIAVLPFVSMSTTREDDYFADGVTEDLISALSRVPGLRVTGRTSSFAYKNSNVSADQIAAKLHVGRLLTGSVQRAGTKVRIRMQLINASDGLAVWSETFDRELEDIFKVQDEISRAIASKLNLSAGSQTLVNPTTVDMSAYNRYLQGKFFFNRRTREALNQAIDFFDQAIQQDSTFALAYVGLADAYSWLADRGFAPQNATQPKAMAAAQRALALDPSLAEAHASLAHLLMHEFDYAASEREFRRAIELNPNYGRARGFYAILLAWTRRSDDARVQVEQALLLDPLENQPIGVFYHLGDPDRTIQLAREALERDPQTMWARMALVQALATKGDLASAVAEARNAVQLAGGYHPEATPVLAQIYAAAGNDSASRRVTNEIEARARREYVPPYFVARAYAAQRNDARMYEWLERAVDIHDGMVFAIKTAPVFEPYAAQPRFRRILRQVGY